VAEEETKERGRNKEAPLEAHALGEILINHRELIRYLFMPTTVIHSIRYLFDDRTIINLDTSISFC